MTKPSSLSSTPKSTKKRVTQSRTTAILPVPVIDLQKAVETVPDVLPITPTLVVKEPIFVDPVSPLSEISESLVSEQGKQQTKKFALWVVVSAMMFLIVFGWAWSLRYSLAIPETIAPSQDFLSATDDLSTLFQKTIGQIKSIELPTPPSEEVDPNVTATPPLTAEELTILKQKVMDTTTPKTLPVQP